MLHTRHGLDGITMHVGGLRLDGSDLTLSLGTLLQLRHLLALYGRCRDLLTEDDVTDLTGGERGDVDTVPFAEILQPESEVEFKILP